MTIEDMINKGMKLADIHSAVNQAWKEKENEREKLERKSELMEKAKKVFEEIYDYFGITYKEEDTSRAVKGLFNEMEYLRKLSEYTDKYDKFFN